MKRESRVVLAFSMACAMVLTTAMPVAAAKKVGLSSKKITVEAGASKKLSVKNTKKKVKWSIKSGKKYVSLKKKKKTSVTVQGKKKGKAVILAKVGKKKLTCKVTVKKAETGSETTPTGAPTTVPSASASTIPAATVPSSGVVSAPPTVEPTPTKTPARTAEPGEFLYEGLDWDWIDANIDPAKPVVAMSFDDGPGGYTSYVEYGTRIQQALKDAGAHATFFYIGQHILHDDESRAEVQQAVDWGFEIANHSWDSNSLSGANMEQEDIRKKIEDTDALLKEISGYSTFLFRAPNVSYSDDMYAVIDKPFIDVSCWSNDWQSSVTKEQIVDNVKKAEDGAIINMHSVHEKTAEAVPEILAYFKQQGIQVVSVSELFAIKGQKLMNGETYSKCETE